MLNTAQKKLLFFSSLGGVLEFYDFIIYALFASYIAKAFFPTGNAMTSLIATFATFSVGYLARPIGGIIFGHFGDKFGRKKTFTVSILMMAIATFLIGLVPSYQAIGIAAPIILTILRVLQGFSVGGEIPGAISYISESIPEHKGMACGIIFCTLVNGIVIGLLVQAVLNVLISPQHMHAWGFRVPFFIGGFFGFFSYFLRRRLNESPLFKMIEQKTEAFPLLKVLHKNFVNALAGIFLVGLLASVTTLLFLFIPAYITNVLHITANYFIWFNALALFLATLLMIFFGMVADKGNHKLLISGLCILTITLAYPIFLIYSHYFAGWFLLALAFSALLIALASGFVPDLLNDLFPTAIRYSGIALSYNFGFAIFGGLTPLIATILIERTGLVTAPAFYLMFVALLAFVAILFVRRGHFNLKQTIDASDFL